MEKVVIAAGARTPIGSFGGTLSNISAYKLASTVINEVVKRTAIEPAWVDDVIVGQSYQNGEGTNRARMAAQGWTLSI